MPTPSSTVGEAETSDVPKWPIPISSFYATVAPQSFWPTWGQCRLLAYSRSFSVLDFKIALLGHPLTPSMFFRFILDQWSFTMSFDEFCCARWKTCLQLWGEVGLFCVVAPGYFRWVGGWFWRFIATLRCGEAHWCAKATGTWSRNRTCGSWSYRCILCRLNLMLHNYWAMNNYQHFSTDWYVQTYRCNQYLCNIQTDMCRNM